MTKKTKSTKQIRAIDRIIKFQIDDGIESLTISGKEVLADVAIDRQANVTLFLNADPDKINEIQSLVPFVTVQTVAGGTDTDKTKTVTLSQDLTQFAFEIADNSKELATLIKSQSSIVLDLNGLVQKLLEIAGKLAELEQKNQEQDKRLTAIEAKDLEQENRLTTIEAKNQKQDNRFTSIEEKNYSQDERLNHIDVTQEAHASKLKAIEDKNVEQDSKLATFETEQAEHASKLATLEQSIGASVDLTPLEQRIANAESIASGLGVQIASIEQITGGLSIKDTELDNRVTSLENGSTSSDNNQQIIAYFSQNIEGLSLLGSFPNNVETIILNCYVDERNTGEYYFTGSVNVIKENQIYGLGSGIMLHSYKDGSITIDNPSGVRIMVNGLCLSYTSETSLFILSRD